MRSRIVGFGHALGATFVLGAVSAFGDWVWNAYIDSHRTLYGIIHGGLLCLFLGMTLAWAGQPPRPWIRGALGGLGVGVSAALSFYLLAPWLRWWAMLPAWVVLWVLASLLGGLLAGSRAVSLERMLRGIIAGVFSGIGFYFAVTQLWMGRGPKPGLFLSALIWMVAFLPGYLPLLVRRPDVE